jgi:hypothetical protein
MNAYRILVGKPKGRRQMEIRRRRWEIILGRILEGYKEVVWIGLI